MKKTVLSAAVLCAVCLCAAPVSAQKSSLLRPYHNDFMFLSAYQLTGNVSIYLYNSITNDPSQYHNVFVLAFGSGTVTLIVTAPDASSAATLSYGIWGASISPSSTGLNPTPITGGMTNNGSFTYPVTIPADGFFCFIFLDISMLYTKGPVDFPVILTVTATETP